MAAISYTFFYKSSHFCSQWFSCKFNIGGRTFNCAEQWMMYSKAILFNDKSTAQLILNSRSPKEQKALGRKVKNFDQARWDRYAKAIVFVGNLAKFSQYPELYDQLVATAGTTLVEASPYDSIWGIGLKQDHPDARQRDRWRGLNWLGFTLTILRDKMMTDGGYRLLSGQDMRLKDVPEEVGKI